MELFRARQSLTAGDGRQRPERQCRIARKGEDRAAVTMDGLGKRLGEAVEKPPDLLSPAYITRDEFGAEAAVAREVGKEHGGVEVR